MKDINQNDSGSGEFADTPTSAPGTKRSSRLSWFRDSRMSSNGRVCSLPTSQKLGPVAVRNGKCISQVGLVDRF